MDNIFEININDLEKEIPFHSVGTLLVCKSEDKIYTYLCKPTSEEKPVWTQLTTECDLVKKLKEMSIVDKVKWLLRDETEGLPDGTDMMSLPYGYYKVDKLDEEELFRMKF